MRTFIASKAFAIYRGPVSRQNGFTLVEMLVVVFLIGLASAAVVMSLPGDAAKVRDQADRLAARIAAARDTAVLETRPMLLWLRPSGYGFEQRKEGAWQAAPGKSFEQVNWQPGTQLSIGSEKQTQVIFDVTGLPSAPLEIILDQGEAKAKITISAAGDVAVAH